MVVIINYGTCAHKGNGWWGGETTLKNGELSELIELFWTERQTAEKQKSAVIEVGNHGT